MEEEFKFEESKVAVADFGYKLVKAKELRLKWASHYFPDFNSREFKDNTLFMIPDFDGLDEMLELKKRLKGEEYIKYFDSFDYSNKKITEDGGLARLFVDINISSVETAHEGYLKFANKFGLLSNDLTFNFRKNGFGAFNLFYCDHIDSWSHCFKQVREILHYLDNRKDLNMTDFTNIDKKHKTKEFVSATYSFNAIGFEGHFDFKNNGGCEFVKVDDIKKIKKLLEYHVIRKVNSHLMYTTQYEIDEAKSPDVYGMVGKPRNTKGAIFLDLAEYFIKKDERMRTKCKKCLKILDLSKSNKNKKFHDRCYETYKKYISRGRKAGKTDKQIAKELKVDEL